MTTYLPVKEEIRARNYTCHSTYLFVIGELTVFHIRTSHLLICDRKFLGFVGHSTSGKTIQLSWTFLLARAQIRSLWHKQVMALVRARYCLGPQLSMFAECLIGVPCFFLFSDRVLVRTFAFSTSVVWLIANLVASEPIFVLIPLSES